LLNIDLPALTNCVIILALIWPLFGGRGTLTVDLVVTINSTFSFVFAIASNEGTEQKQLVYAKKLRAKENMKVSVCM
jgi:hypothetical protein